MTAGRPAKSIAQHKAEGTFRPGSHTGPSLPLEIPATPPDLAPRAQACWNVMSEHIRFAGVVSRVDGAALRLLCESWDVYIEACDAIRSQGITCAVQTKTGTRLWKHPAIEIRATAWKEIVTILRQFGLTPASRTTLRPGNAGKSKSEEERVAGILKMRGAG